MLMAYRESLAMVRLLRELLPVVARQDANLASQLRRAASSVVLNVAEGSGRWGKDSIRMYRIARGSAREVMAALDLAVAFGHVDSAAAADAAAKATQVCNMLYGLTR